MRVFFVIYQFQDNGQWAIHLTVTKREKIVPVSFETWDEAKAEADEVVADLANHGLVVQAHVCEQHKTDPAG